ncbi:hypothetical protein SCOR_10585 [Sulfidibacter corallicola]|uniref:Uncharacterized protein n=1 Tax=Sulfidibacter corallicola TaxID=2818388 RepID=A0A8A4TDP8_SULCO|nr:hypothetical protein [Sulfidibacter corallicola]QTD48219.1 hypothetical protein J3U87_21755 [Sulfidibacter corallicola]
MGQQLQFVRLNTSLKGLVQRAITQFNRYIDIDPGEYHWVIIEDPETIARTLEVLSSDMPEEDLAQVVTRLPYLILLFQKTHETPGIPVEPTLGFLSILNHAGMVTILRQCSDRHRLGTMFNLDPEVWNPLIFMLAGIPDLDRCESDPNAEQCSFF